MFERLLPKSAPYYQYFGRQNQILQEMCEQILHVVNMENEPGATPEAEPTIIAMTKLEEEADSIRHIVVHELAQTFITPIDREDIYALCMAQERVIDRIKNLALRFYFLPDLRVRFPAYKMLETMPEMSRLIGQMLICLEKNSDPSEYVAKISSLSEEATMFLGVGLSELHDLDMPDMKKVKALLAWSQLYDRIEDSLELFSELTDTLEQVVLKYA